LDTSVDKDAMSKHNRPRIGQLVRYANGKAGVIRSVGRDQVHVFVDKGESVVPISELRTSEELGTWELARDHSLAIE